MVKIDLPEPTQGVIVRNVPEKKSELDRYMNRLFLITSNNALTCFIGTIGRFYECFDEAVYHVIGDNAAIVSPVIEYIDGILRIRILYDEYYNDFIMRMVSKDGECHLDEIKKDECIHLDHPEWFEKIEIQKTSE